MLNFQTLSLRDDPIEEMVSWTMKELFENSFFT
jgi:hypothetical protein